MTVKRQQSFQSRNRQQGLSLVELMIALAIGAALIGGIIQVFTSNNAAFRTQQAASRMQENARFAFHFLSSELRQAGYSGCAGSAKNTNVLDVADGDEYNYLFNFTKSVEGYDLAEESLPDDAPDLDPAPRADTDVIMLRRAGEDQVAAAEDQPSKNAANFKTDVLHDFEEGEILTISDCQNSWTFQVTNANQTNHTVVANKGKGTPGNAKKLTQDQLGPDFSVSRSLATFFYIAESESNSGEPALYRKVNDDPAEELVTGVEDMQLEYGLDTDIQFVNPSNPAPDCEVDDKGDGDVDEFEKAADIADIDDGSCEWAQVIGVRLSLLVRSQSEQVMPDGQSYQFAGAEETSDDGRLRHVVNSTITLRNKTR